MTYEALFWVHDIVYYYNPQADKVLQYYGQESKCNGNDRTQVQCGGVNKTIKVRAKSRSRFINTSPMRAWGASSAIWLKRAQTLIWKWSPALPVRCAFDDDYSSQHATKNINFLIDINNIACWGISFNNSPGPGDWSHSFIWNSVSLYILSVCMLAMSFFTSVSGTCFRPGLRSLHYDEYTNIGVQDVAWVILPTVNQVLDSLSQLQHQSLCLLHNTNVSS